MRLFHFFVLSLFLVLFSPVSAVAKFEPDSLKNHLFSEIRATESVQCANGNCRDRKIKLAQKACQMDAKICPDGSSVVRTGPNCKFPKCPVVCNAIRCQAGYTAVFDKNNCPTKCVPAGVGEIAPEQCPMITCVEGLVPDPGAKCPERCVEPGARR